MLQQDASIAALTFAMHMPNRAAFAPAPTIALCRHTYARCLHRGLHRTCQDRLGWKSAPQPARSRVASSTMFSPPFVRNASRSLEDCLIPPILQLAYDSRRYGYREKVREALIEAFTILREQQNTLYSLIVEVSAIRESLNARRAVNTTRLSRTFGQSIEKKPSRQPTQICANLTR